MIYTYFPPKNVWIVCLKLSLPIDGQMSSAQRIAKRKIVCLVHSFPISYTGSLLAKFGSLVLFKRNRKGFRHCFAFAVRSDVIEMFSIVIISFDFLFLFLYGISKVCSAGFMWPHTFRDSTIDIRKIMLLSCSRVTLAPVFRAAVCALQNNIVDNPMLKHIFLYFLLRTIYSLLHLCKTWKLNEL